MSGESPRISVVVPTRDRPEPLKRCLAALEAQTVPVEIVVVEDEGVRRAMGEVVCFTDDDCAPFPGWAQALATPILAGEAQAATGPTLMAAGATASDRAWEAIVTHLQKRAATPGTASPGFAVTANLACSRRLLEQLAFDESFPAAAGEDRDWGERAARLGAAPLLVSGALVVHRSGMRNREFLRQQYRYGHGAARYRSADADRRLGSVAFYAGLLRQGFTAGLMPGLLLCAAQAATLAGVLAAGRDQNTRWNR
jgi:GT2 family glycosyltransferase